MNFLYIILFVLSVALVYRKNNTTRTSRSAIIQSLYSQTARWATASLQDNSPLISVLHANYAVGYVQALQQAFSEKEIFDVVGKDVRRLSKHCVEIQRKATINLAKLCPNVIDRTELSILAGESI